MPLFNLPAPPQDRDFNSVSWQRWFIQLREGVVTTSQTATDLELTSNALNLKAYGAKGDGVTDDAAIVAAAIQESDEIYAPPGIYLLNSTVPLRAGVRLYGASRNASIFKKTNFAGAAFLGIDTDGVNLENFKIQGPGQWVGTGNKGVDIHVSSQEIVQGLSFRNVDFEALNDICLYVGTGAFCTYLGLRMRDYGYAGLYIDGGDGHGLLACSTRNGIIGYMINRPTGYGPTTVTGHACYAEQAGIGFNFIGAVASALFGCGVEAPINYGASFPGNSYIIDGGDNVSLHSCLSRCDTIGAAIAAAHVLVKGGASRVKIDGFRRDNHATFTPPVWELDATAAGSVLLGLNNFTAGTINSGGIVSVYDTTVLP